MLIETKTDEYKVVKINAPEWFRNKEFMEWLNAASGTPPNTGPATVWTWHRPGANPNCYADIVMTYSRNDTEDPEDDEGSNSDCPLWPEITKVVRKNHPEVREALVWITNLG